MRRIFVPLLGLLFFAGAGCASRDHYDLLRTPGQEKEWNPAIQPGEVLPFSRVIVSAGKDFAIQNPEKRRFITVGFSELPLVAWKIYRFTLRGVGREGLEIAAFGNFFADGQWRTDRNLLRTTLFLNVNGATSFGKDFAVTPGRERLIPAVTFFRRGGADMLPGTLCLLEELSVECVGDMKRASAEVRAQNLAASLDFDRMPAGDFRAMHKGEGPRAAKWSDVVAEIADCPGGGRALHIVRTKENYVYPYLELAPFSVDPQYHYVKVSFEARGKGAFRIGLWWKRKHLEWDYENAPECRLTDEWQTFTCIRPCLTPDVTAPTLAFNSGDDGEYWIRNIRVSLE